MSSEKDSKSDVKNAQTRKLRAKLNQYISLLAVVVIFVAINIISFKNFDRRHFSLVDYAQLGSQSINLLQELQEPVTMINFVNPQGDAAAGLIAADVEKLLQEYRYVSSGKVQVLRVDPFIDFEQAREVAAEYKLTTEENAVIVRFGDRHRVLNYRDMADIDESMAFHGGAPSLLAFKAEQVITSAIHELAFGDKAVVYFLTGNGEMDPRSRSDELQGISVLVGFIERQNARVETLNLRESPAIPMDADMLVIAGPTQKYSEFQIDLLKDYLQRNAEIQPALFIFLDPETETGLETFLSDKGVVFRDDLVLFQADILGQLRLVPQAIATIFSEHPVTAWLLNSRTAMDFGRARSIDVAESVATGTAQALAMTSGNYWGETDYRTDAARFDAEEDTSGPLTLAAVIDSGSVAGTNIQLAGSRIVAVGSASFLSNRVISTQAVDFFLNGMAWLLDRKESMGIAPKTPTEFTINLDDRQKRNISLVVMGVIPGIGLVLALLVWWRRR